MKINKILCVAISTFSGKMDLPELRDAAMVQIQGLRNLLGVLRNQIHGQHGVVYLQNVVDRLRTIEHDLLGLNLEPLWNPGNMEEAREITNAAIAELIDRLALVSDYVNEVIFCCKILIIICY